MGYYTEYTLYTFSSYESMERHFEGTSDDMAIGEDLNKICDFYSDEEYTRRVNICKDPFFFITEGAMKWYDFDNDMTKISKLYPNIYFMLYGEGEDESDIWRICYHKGKGYEMRGYIEYERLPTEEQLKKLTEF